MTKIENLDIEGSVGGSVPEGVNTCKITAADYGEDTFQGKSQGRNVMTLDLECQGLDIKWVKIYEPAWKWERVFKSVTPKPKEADTKYLVGGEIKVLLFKGANGYMKAYQVVNPNQKIEDDFANSVKQGYVKVHESSVFASLLEEDFIPEVKPSEIKTTGKGNGGDLPKEPPW
jgi:hypothetical protein